MFVVIVQVWYSYSITTGVLVIRTVAQCTFSFVHVLQNQVSIIYSGPVTLVIFVVNVFLFITYILHSLHYNEEGMHTVPIIFCM
jgi:hypothetical protein